VTLNGSDNGTDCSDLKTSGTFGSIAAGDYVWVSGQNVPAIVTQVVSSAEILVGANGKTGATGLGAGGCANGSTLGIAHNFWTSGAYGDDGKGLREQFINPQYRCPSCNSLTWDSTVTGGDGTAADARDQIMCNLGEGTGADGTACTADPRATIANLRAYLQWAYTPMNGQLYSAAPDGQTYGALPGIRRRSFSDRVLKRWSA
jgi:hypothetical protein